MLQLVLLEAVVVLSVASAAVVGKARAHTHRVTHTPHTRARAT